MLLQDSRSIESKLGGAPHDVPNGPQIALFSDPDGNVVGLVKPTE